jgi:tRNA-intron endonuclease
VEPVNLSETGEEKLEEPTKLCGFLHRDSSKVIVFENGVAAFYEQGYYGTLEDDKGLSLEPEEALLLFERKRLEITLNNSDSGESEPLTAGSLVRIFSENDSWFWVRYQVYKDLRNRGYVVRLGYGKFAPYRLYPRGASAEGSVSKKLVYPLGEGDHLDLERLDQIVANARSSRKDLLLGVVDRLGDVTYYQASQLELKRNPCNYEFRDEGETTHQEEG